MLEVRNRQRFPLPRASGRCGFGEVTFAGTHGNDEDVPEAAVRSGRRHRQYATLSGRSLPSIAMPARAPNRALPLGPINGELGR
jgi:hypothetical protein